MATMANHDRETSLPICQNCSTSTTPLWRRDEMGSVLCNACGLFLKLHGRPRPISLKTDVIKSRNRVKTSMRPDMVMKKKNNAAAAAAAAAVAAAAVGDHNSVVDLQGHAFAATAALSARGTPHKGANGHHLDGTDSPMSGGTPGMYNTSSASYPILDDSQYQGQHLGAFGASGDGAGHSGSPVNGDMPQSQDQLAATNRSLKTRVAELEVINDFIQRRLGHYEPPYGTGQDGQDANQQANDAQLRSQVDLLTQAETQLRAQLEESHRRENMLKRRLDELELELKETKDALGAYEGNRAKKPRLGSQSTPGSTIDVVADAAAAAPSEAEAKAEPAPSGAASSSSAADADAPAPGSDEAPPPTEDAAKSVADSTPAQKAEAETAEEGAVATADAAKP